MSLRSASAVKQPRRPGTSQKCQRWIKCNAKGRKYSTAGKGFSAYLTSVNQKRRKEGTEKNIAPGGANHLPNVEAKRRERGRIVRADAVLVHDPESARKSRADREMAS